MSHLIAEAVEWLNATDTVPITRQTAENLLPHWPHHANLTDAERRLTLDHFGAAEAPELPGCGQPATSWIGMYAPGQNTAYGNLKATLYVCEAHAVDGVEVAHKLDLTPHCFPDSSALPTPCGLFYDFRAGAVRPAAEIAHAGAESGAPVPDQDDQADTQLRGDCIGMLKRIGERLADADRAARRAYAAGYVAGVRDRLDIVHAWKITRVDGDRAGFLWTCRCGATERQPEGLASAELVDRLRAHCVGLEPGTPRDRGIS